jgi:two-component system, NarL family, response regulator NreC
MGIRIILGDDHKIVRDGLRSLIEQQGMTVAAEAEDGREAVQLARKICPDLIIMDVGMPGLNGIEATRQILAENRSIRIIALSMHSDKRFVARMLEAGAMAYLLKDCAFEELATAIGSVLGGKVYLSPRITGVVVQD